MGALHRFLTPALLMGLLCLALAPVALAGDCPDKRGGIAVTGRASLELTPDLGKLTVGVVNQAPTSAEAARMNAQAMEKVALAVKAKLGPQDKLRTVGYFLYPKQEWDQAARKMKRVGFEASNRLEVTSGEPKALGEILDAAVGAGANIVNGPAWSLAEPAEARRQAQEKALADARVQAESLARAAGVGLGPVISINASADEGPGLHQQALMRAPAPAAAGAPETALEPGVVKVEAALTCIYALQARP